MAKLGIHYAYWGTEWKVDLLERVRRAAAAGFDVIEITPPDFMMNLDADRMRELKDCAAENNIEMSFCIGFPKDLDMASPDAAVRQKGMKYTRNILEAVHRMGGKILSGILYSYWPFDYNEPVDKEGAWKRGLESVREVVKTAEDLDITYGIELVNRFEQYVLNSVEEGIEFVTQVGNPKCGILLDMFHMSIEEDNPADAIRKAGKLLCHLHISQNNRKIPAPGGPIDWPAVAQALKDIGFGGRVVMEPFVQRGGPVGLDLKIFRDLVPDTSPAGLDKALAEGLRYARSVFA